MVAFVVGPCAIDYHINPLEQPVGAAVRSNGPNGMCKGPRDLLTIQPVLFWGLQFLSNIRKPHLIR